MSKSNSNPQYKDKNWSSDDASLEQRRSLTFWFSPEMIEQWLNQEKTGCKGASNIYSNVAIELMATLKSLFCLTGRQTKSFLESIFASLGIDLPVPDHTTLSRRFRKMDIDIPVLPAKEALHLMIDPRVVNVYAQEEWNTRARVDGIDKAQTWRQLNIDVDEATGEIVTAAVSTNNVSEDQVFLEEVVENQIGQMSGEGVADIPVVPPTEAIHQVAGAREFNFYGEGEWKITVDGIGKCQKWCKQYISFVGKATRKIVQWVSTNNVSEDQVFLQPLDGVESQIGQMLGNGIYDGGDRYKEANHRGAKLNIPLCQNAVFWHHGDCKSLPHFRDENLREICRVGRPKPGFGNPRMLVRYSRNNIEFALNFSSGEKLGGGDTHHIATFVQPKNIS